MSAIYSELSFETNPLFERIISDLLAKDFALLDNLFDTNTVDLIRAALINHFEEDRFKKAAIGNRTNELIATGIRGDYILWIDDSLMNEATRLFFEKINQLIDYLNRTCFLGILQKEFHYALYPPAAGYKRHLDSFQNDDRRKLSIAFYLNETDWQETDGGELALYLQQKDGLEKTQMIVPKAGRMVIFESQKIPHEVLPASRERLSITGWLKTR